MKQIMKIETLQVRKFIKAEWYEEISFKPSNLLGYIFCELQVGDQYIKGEKSSCLERNKVNCSERMTVNFELHNQST